MSSRDLYDGIDLGQIEGFAASRAEEHLHLDFKLAKVPMTRDDRKTLAIATSGFSNSAGGVLIWGVETKRDSAASPDTAFTLKPIQSLAAFMGALHSNSPSSVSPMVEGVQHKSVPSGPDKGFAITLIPPSDSGPHMAKAGEDRYYKRNGDTFIRMEHFELEDMFGRRPHPVLSIYYHITDGGTVGQTRMARILVGVRNTGRGAAHHLFLELQPCAPLSVSHYGIDGNYNHGLPRLPSSSGAAAERFGAQGQIVLYPGMDLDVTAFQLRVDRTLFLHEALTMGYAVAADGLPLSQGVLTIPPGELLRV